MSDIILMTKLFAPALRPKLVPRQRLLTRLNKGLNGKMTLVSAPAGFGKSTLVLDWLQQIDRPFAWLSLDAQDDEPRRFFSYLLAAIQTIDPQIGVELVMGLKSADIDLAALTPLLLNELLASNTPFVLVLDDYHTIQHSGIHEALSQLVDYLPATAHLVLTSRTDPPLPLPRWRVRGQLNEIRASELRFTNAEAARFLQSTMGIEIEASAIATLESRTEGWIAGLQLAALSLRSSDNRTRFIADFVGSNRQVADYLVQEVLSQQSAEIKTFLLHTSILTRFNADLCNTLLQDEKGHATLAALDQANLLVIPLDNARRWYRYHHLFGELLQNRLAHTVKNNDVADLHQRAARWYADHQLLDEAIAHWLQIPDYVAVAEQLAAESPERIFEGELGLRLLDWVAQLPKHILKQYPHVSAIAMFAAMISGNARLAQSYFDQIDGEPETAHYQDLFRSVLARNVDGDFEQALKFADRVITNEKSGGIFDAYALLQKAVNYFYLGQYEDADTVLLKAHGIVQAQHTNSLNIHLQILNLQANNLRIQGSYRRVELLCLDGIQAAVQDGVIRSPTIGFLYNVLANVYYATNQLEKSAEYADRALTLGQRTANADILLTATDVKAKVACAQQNVAKLRDVLTIIESRLQQLNDEHAFVIFEEYKARYSFWIGEIEPAARWVNSAEYHPDDTPTLRMLESYHTVCAIWLAQVRISAETHPLPAIMALIERIEALVVQVHHMEGLVQTLLLKAMALDLAADKRAHVVLQQAIDIAAPSNMMRAFLNWGEPMKVLLHQLPADKHGAFIGRLLSQFPTAPAAQQHGAPALELTTREQEILQLLADGLSNKQIEETLFISKNTVRTHLKNLYSKLHVSSRTQAVKQAQVLRLLTP